MNSKIFIFLQLVLFGLVAADSIDVIARAELEALRALVLENIEQSHNVLLYLAPELALYAAGLDRKGKIEREQILDEFKNELERLEVSSAFKGKNIASCTNFTKSTYEQSLEKIGDTTHGCLEYSMQDVMYTIWSRRYDIDCSILQVQEFDYDLGQCEPDDMDCFSDIKSEMDFDKTRLPNEIQETLDYVLQSMDFSKEFMQSECINSKKTILKNALDSLLNNVKNCVNQL